ncbi:MAG: Rare lipoprotein A precursor [uncultured Sulfurovum sp.]|uniref:Probable endolytic peptidoglycan transglycosylase RlpA n=1 Tax=uncultured Sulfurovum sp. TaxID=269237 RepID=A0A6S6SZ81_9BACT|nr:MAG: Rare lipoprotein A precursor [uncultured Sulfurovum sp.]
MKKYLNKYLIFTLIFALFTTACSQRSPNLEVGNGSWYGEKYHGRTTANGETYNMYALTAAHKTLPFNTMVKVTNLKNNRSIIVRINDRGPFVRGRIIDLSYGAAKALDYITDGVVKLRVEVQ